MASGNVVKSRKRLEDGVHAMRQRMPAMANTLLRLMFPDIGVSTPSEKCLATNFSQGSNELSRQTISIEGEANSCEVLPVREERIIEKSFKRRNEKVRTCSYKE